MSRWVVFDLGGVLVRITLKPALAAARIGLSLPAEWPYEDFQEIPSFLAYQRGEVDDDTYLEGLAQDIGGTPEAALALHNAILIEPFAGTAELIDELHAAGVRTGVLSNTNALHWAEIQRWESSQQIQIQVASHEQRLEKPDVAIFRRFEMLSGAEAPIFFDDSRANVEGAKAAGWAAYWIDALGDPAQQMRERLQELGLLSP